MPMPPIRFRIRTIMFAAVMVAVIMAVFMAVMRLPPWIHPLRDAYSVSCVMYTYMISHPIMILLATALFFSVVQFVVFLDRFRSLRRRPAQHSKRAHGPIPRPDPDEARS
jgi:hypothetical protein